MVNPSHLTANAGQVQNKNLIITAQYQMLLLGTNNSFTITVLAIKHADNFNSHTQAGYIKYIIFVNNVNLLLIAETK